MHRETVAQIYLKYIQPILNSMHGKHIASLNFLVICWKIQNSLLCDPHHKLSHIDGQQILS